MARLVWGVRTDHEAMRGARAKYDTRPQGAASLAKDGVEKIGFQMMVAYRVMRFLVDADARLASRAASRGMRHLYGSDVHWDAQLDPGVMLVHGMGMAISHGAHVARGAILFQHCTIGEGRHPDTGLVGAPVIEEDVVVGAGATLLGPITIGARTKIMPGCVVVRDVPPDSIVEAPPPVVRARARRSRPAGGDEAEGRGGA
jgi:serine O-acetyltransferase